MSQRDLRTLSLISLEISPKEFKDQLIPVLPEQEQKKMQNLNEYIALLMKKCVDGMEMLYPFTEAEQNFLDSILNEAEIKPELITQNSALQKQIQNHPVLHWTVAKVKKYKPTLSLIMQNLPKVCLK